MFRQLDVGDTTQGVATVLKTQGSAKPQGDV